MSERFFSDRETGPAPRVHEVLPDSAWRGLCALVTQVRQQQRLAHDFPEHCPDPDKAALVIASDYVTLRDAWQGAVPDVDLPFRGEMQQALPVALDSIEFLFDHVHQPTPGDEHGFYGHRHLRFFPDGRREARQQLVREVNDILARNGVAFELTRQGEFRRIGPEVILAALATAPERRTDDDEVNRLLTEAKQRFLRPGPESRREALQLLWDAFERLKTLLGAKKVGMTLLIEKAVMDPGLRERLEGEAKELTNIGNHYWIRHSETGQVPLETQAQADYLFTRLWALIELVAPQSSVR